MLLSFHFCTFRGDEILDALEFFKTTISGAETVVVDKRSLVQVALLLLNRPSALG